MAWGDQVADDESEVEEVDNSEEEPSEQPISAIAPNVIGRKEAVDRERVHTILVWAEPGKGKTHFSFTTPDPVCIIDTEHKAHDIIHKFDGSDVGDDPFIWEVNDFDDAVSAMEEAIDVLDYYYRTHNMRGTIVVDSMSDLWDWAQSKYISMYYPNTPEADVNLTTGIGGGSEDWAKIKDIHNNEFRQPIVTSGYNVVWTSTRKDDIKRKMEEGLDFSPSRPGGEKYNGYKTNFIIRIYDSPTGVPTASLEKSGWTKLKYMGLEYPTFDKHVEIIEAIEETELRGGDAIENIPYDIEITEGTPQYIQEMEKKADD